ncbi:MAG: hypothetical protein OXK76_03630 [Gammaproteobacteria bacterium]|nr:hypothetical protein [Gammaproteobacteria bacterium]
MQLKDFPLSITVAACVTGAALVANVLAAPKERPASIDLSELKAAEEERFTAADADGDGLVTAEEFAAVDPRRFSAGIRSPGDRGGWQRRVAGDGTRGLDREAKLQRMEQRRAEIEKRIAEGEKRRQKARRSDFETADSDGDGQLSAEEYGDMPTTLKTARQREMFARLDGNEDGVLTPEEFPSMVDRLQALDADGDGLVTREEMRAGRNR